MKHASPPLFKSADTALDGRPETLRLHVGEPHEIAVGPVDVRTGYVWMVRELPGCVALESTRDVPPSTPAHGRLASRVFRVVGARRGHGIVQCVLAPVWNPGESVEERRFRVEVETPAGTPR